MRAVELNRFDIRTIHIRSRKRFRCDMSHNLKHSAMMIYFWVSSVERMDI